MKTKVNFKFPTAWDSNEFDSHKENTKDWVISLIEDNALNLAKLLTWFKLDTYEYSINHKDPEGPNIHTFIFKPKRAIRNLMPGGIQDDSIMDFIREELNERPFIDNPIEESFYYGIAPDYQTIVITLKASE